MRALADMAEASRLTLTEERAAVLSEAVALRGAARIVLLALLAHAKDGTCWPSDARLGRMTGMSARAVRSARHELRAAGLVTWSVRNGSPNRYQLNLDALTDLGRNDRGQNYRGQNYRGQNDRGPRQILPGTAADSAEEPTKEPTKEPTTSVGAGSDRPSEVVLTFPTKSGEPWTLTAAKLAEYQQTHPTLDVLTACREARQWCIDNPPRRKTPHGMPKFLGGWLRRAEKDARTTKPRQRVGAPAGGEVAQCVPYVLQALTEGAATFDELADEVPFGRPELTAALDHLVTADRAVRLDGDRYAPREA